MILPVTVVFLTVSIFWLIAAIQRKNPKALLLLYLFWGLGATGSAYFVWMAWDGRGESENWALLGFLFCSLPYIAATGLMVLISLLFTRRWRGRGIQRLRRGACALLLFLAAQLLIGLLSG